MVVVGGGIDEAQCLARGETFDKAAPDGAAQRFSVDGGSFSMTNHISDDQSNCAIFHGNGSMKIAAAWGNNRQRSTGDVELGSDRNDGPFAGLHRFTALEFLARWVDHIPDAYETRVRYYGAYAIRRRVWWRGRGSGSSGG